MKITIEVFGPIKKFEYDLDKDFIVTYGNNNIGKSYAMQIVYLLLKTFTKSVQSIRIYHNTDIPLPIMFNDMKLTDLELQNVFESFIQSEQIEKDITDLFNDMFFTLFSEVFVYEFINSCKNTFGNLEKILNRKPTIHFNGEQYTFAIYLKDKMVKGKINNQKVILHKGTSDYIDSKSFNGSQKDITYPDQYDVYVYPDSDCNTEIQSEMFITEIKLAFSKWTRYIRSIIREVYFLPASRSGIYSGMNAFSPIMAELSKNRAYINRKIDLPGISEPISDYFIALSTIKSSADDEYEQYYSKIERDLLKGKVTFDNQKNSLIYFPNDLELKFEMTEVSSMVSEIAPIVAFMKYIINSQPTSESENNGKVILFIEEPEAHLHPNNQIALMEVFAELSKTNIKLIMSSHSNYVFVKLNNMVLSKQLDYQRYQPIILNETSEGSVSKKLKIDELGAWDENFTDVSERLYEERDEIIEKLNTREE
jgi:predicted ATPase